MREERVHNAHQAQGDALPADESASAETEARAESTGTSESTETTPPAEAASPGHRGKVGRIAVETRGLFEDLKEWVDLKIQLLQIDVEERIERAANQAVIVAVVVVLALFTVLFGLVSAGIALGYWLDNQALGFLVLTGLLGLITFGLYTARPRFRRGSKDDDAQTPAEPRARIPQHPESRESNG